jgi:hypothetical protein
MDSILLIAKMAAEAGALLRELAALSKRVAAGEEITQADIDAAHQQANDAMARWNEELKK